MRTALAEVGVANPPLRLVPAPATPTEVTGGRPTPTRARVVAAIVVVLLLSVLVTLNGVARQAAAVDERPAVAGHAVVEPGESLWSVAVAYAPAGSDPRRFLAQIQELNGFDDANVPAWTVVLLPDLDGS